MGGAWGRGRLAHLERHVHRRMAAAVGQDAAVSGGRQGRLVRPGYGAAEDVAGAERLPRPTRAAALQLVEIFASKGAPRITDASIWLLNTYSAGEGPASVRRQDERYQNRVRRSKRPGAPVPVAVAPSGGEREARPWRPARARRADRRAPAPGPGRCAAPRRGSGARPRRRDPGDLDFRRQALPPALRPTRPPGAVAWPGAGARRRAPLPFAPRRRRSLGRRPSCLLAAM